MAAKDSILAYDAFSTLLDAASAASQQNKASCPKPETVLQKLCSISMQGLSGKISFDSFGEVQDKAIVILHIEQRGIQIVSIQGNY